MRCVRVLYREGVVQTVKPRRLGFQEHVRRAPSIGRSFQCEALPPCCLQVMDVNDIPRIVKEAFYLARTGRPGVWRGGSRGCPAAGWGQGGTLSAAACPVDSCQCVDGSGQGSGMSDGRRQPVQWRRRGGPGTGVATQLQPGRITVS